MVTLRKKERVSYSDRLELPSDVESIVDSASDNETAGQAAGPSKRSSRRKPVPERQNDQDDSDVSNFHAASLDSEDEPILVDEESEEDDFAPEQSPELTKASKRHRQRDHVQKERSNVDRLGVRRDESPVMAEDTAIGGDDLTALLAQPSAASSNRDRTANRIEILQSSIPITPFGHTRLRKAPTVGGEDSTSANMHAHPVNGISSQARIQHMRDTTDALESHWSKWLGKPWSADGVAGRRGQMADVKMQEPRRMSESEAKPYIPKEAGPIVCKFGNHDEAKSIQIHVYGAHSLAATSILNNGWVFNAGGPITGLAWRPSGFYEEDDTTQYVAIAPHSLSMTKQVDLERNKQCGLESTKIPTKSSIQIWQLDEGELQCKQVFCVDRECFLEVKWLPPQMWSGLDAQDNLGLLSAVSNDGKIYWFCLPKPSNSIADGPDYYHLQPLASLRAEEAACVCSDWTDDGKLAVGLSNGAISVFQLSEAFVRGADADRPVPIQYLQPHLSCVKSVAWMTQPSTDADGAAELVRPPSSLLSSSFDGSIFVSDIRDPSSSFMFTSVSRFYPVVAWAQHVAVILFSEPDYWVSFCRLRRLATSRMSKVQDHGGAVMSIATSDYHGMMASAAADGTVRFANLMRSTTRIPKNRPLVETLYRLDYDEHSSEYRMVDNFLPQPIATDAKYNTRTKLGQTIATTGDDTYRVLGVAWHPNTTVIRVQWQNGAGLANAGMLASGSGSGLGRIDIFNERQDGTGWHNKEDEPIMIKAEDGDEIGHEDEDAEIAS